MQQLTSQSCTYTNYHFYYISIYHFVIYNHALTVLSCMYTTSQDNSYTYAYIDIWHIINTSIAFFLSYHVSRLPLPYTSNIHIHTLLMYSDTYIYSDIHIHTYTHILISLSSHIHFSLLSYFMQ